MTKQEENMCVPAVMEFLYNFLGGDITQSAINAIYETLTGESIGKDGIDADYLLALVQNYFATTTFDTYQNAVDRGHFIMVNIPEQAKITRYVNGVPLVLKKENPDPNKGHQVLVVGIEANGNLIVMDPAVGGQVSYPQSNISPDNKIVITGLKN